jgi:hypothetical protein
MSGRVGTRLAGLLRHGSDSIAYTIVRLMRLDSHSKS